MTKQKILVFFKEMYTQSTFKTLWISRTQPESKQERRWTRTLVVNPLKNTDYLERMEILLKYFFSRNSSPHHCHDDRVFVGSQWKQFSLQWSPSSSIGSAEPADAQSQNPNCFSFVSNTRGVRVCFYSCSFEGLKGKMRIVYSKYNNQFLVNTALLAASL